MSVTLKLKSIDCSCIKCKGQVFIFDIDGDVILNSLISSGLSGFKSLEQSKSFEEIDSKFCQDILYCRNCKTAKKKDIEFPPDNFDIFYKSYMIDEIML